MLIQSTFRDNLNFFFLCQECANKYECFIYELKKIYDHILGTERRDLRLPLKVFCINGYVCVKKSQIHS